MTKDKIAAMGTAELEAAKLRLGAEYHELSRRRAIEGQRDVDEACKAKDLELWRVKVELRKRAMVARGGER